MSSKLIVPKGTVFNRLTVIEELPTKITAHSRRRFFKCQCECGNTIEIALGQLRKGTISCGCYHTEVATTHGDACKRFDDGTALCGSFRNIRRKLHYCEKTNHQPTCQWTNLDSFKTWAMANGYQENYCLYRHNTNGDYNADNCFWAPRSLHCITAVFDPTIKHI